MKHCIKCLFTFLVLLGIVAFTKGQMKVIKFDDKKSKFDNISLVIDNLLKNYDTRLRPNFGMEPLDVSMEIIISSFDSISEVNMDYTLTIFLNQYWKDERLKFGDSDDCLTLMSDFAENIWVPDTFIANDKHAFLHDVTEKNKMIKLKGNGEIMYGIRFTTTLSCMMDLRHYPLDSQNCTVEIESYGYTNSEVNIRWLNSKTSVKGVDKLRLPQFNIADFKTSTYIEKESTGAYVRLSLSFLFKRFLGYFIFQTYLPSVLIVMLSWVSFWINHEATSARVALGITTVLTMTTISTGVRASLPRISYVKAIDIYLVTCFIFVFAALLEYAAVNYTYWSTRAKKEKKVLEKSLGIDLNHQIKKSRARNRKKSDFEEDTLNITYENKLNISPLPWLIKDEYPGSKSNQKLGNLILLKQKSVSYAVRNQEATIKQRKYPTEEPMQPLPSTSFISHSNFIAQNVNYSDLNGYCKFKRANSNRNQLKQKRNLKSSIKYKANQFKNHLISDINLVDTYSRVIFPLLFGLFNLFYWTFYIYQSTVDSDLID